MVSFIWPIEVWPSLTYSQGKLVNCEYTVTLNFSIKLILHCLWAWYFACMFIILYVVIKMDAICSKSFINTVRISSTHQFYLTLHIGKWLVWYLEIHTGTWKKSIFFPLFLLYFLLLFFYPPHSSSPLLFSLLLPLLLPTFISLFFQLIPFLFSSSASPVPTAFLPLALPFSFLSVHSYVHPVCFAFFFLITTLLATTIWQMACTILGILK